MAWHDSGIKSGVDALMDTDTLKMTHLSCLSLVLCCMSEKLEHMGPGAHTVIYLSRSIDDFRERNRFTSTIVAWNRFKMLRTCSKGPKNLKQDFAGSHMLSDPAGILPCERPPGRCFAS